MSRLRRSLACVSTLALLFAPCGGSDSADAPEFDVSADLDEPEADDLDLSFDLDELEADEADREAEIAEVDLTQGFQCPTIDNQAVADVAPSRVSSVSEGADGCIFYFEGRDIDPLRIDTYDKEIFTDTAPESAAILQASTGGRAIEVPNALAAYLFEDGFMRENLPEPGDGAMAPGRQVIGYFLGTRGIRLVAVFPDAIVGLYDGSDAAADEVIRADFFESVIKQTVYSAG